MMMNKRLIGMVGGVWNYIIKNVLFQWLAMAANVVMVLSIGFLLQQVFLGTVSTQQILSFVLVLAAAAVVRYACTLGATKMSHLSAALAKSCLREKLYKKMLSLGMGYGQHIKTAEAVQIAGEGVEQLETYFGNYLPQLIYSVLAPVTLFVIFLFINVPSAVVLIACVPAIPIAIMAIQKAAKKIFRRYWGSYTDLGAGFLENVEGLTTLKIYGADERKHQEMNKKAEEFRIATMKVLTMQLGSVTVMDIVAFGGSAVGILVAILQFSAGAVSLLGCIAIVLLSAEFFIPLRLLGSFFHVAMNGMAASEKMFELLDVEERKTGKERLDAEEIDIRLQDVTFSYEKERSVLNGVSLQVLAGSFVSVVGESGSGKSTIAALITGMQKGYGGQILVAGKELGEIDEKELMKHVTLVGHQSYLFSGTVRENLLMACPDATEEQLWKVLKQVRMEGVLKELQGLNTKLEENAANISGGQRQRIAIARALLHDSPVYIFDEATSNIDMESEECIMDVIHSLKKTKSILMISHRLANAVGSDCIYVLRDGVMEEAGTHDELLMAKGFYATLYKKQRELEQFETKVGQEVVCSA